MRKPKIEPPEFPKIIETFFDNPISNWIGHSGDSPSCINVVRFRKFRVTVERVEEPMSVLKARLQKLWDECDNHHMWGPLNGAAKSIGVELVGSAGSKKKERR